MKLSRWPSGRLWHCCRGWERGGWVGESAAQDTTNALIAARLLTLISRYCHTSMVLSFQPLILVLQTGDGESVWDRVQQWACQLPEHLERRRHQDDQGEIELINLGLWGEAVNDMSRYKYPPPPRLLWNLKTNGRLLGAGRKTGKPWFQRLFRSFENHTAPKL